MFLTAPEQLLHLSMYVLPATATAIMGLVSGYFLQRKQNNRHLNNMIQLAQVSVQKSNKVLNTIQSTEHSLQQKMALHMQQSAQANRVLHKHNASISTDYETLQQTLSLVSTQGERILQVLLKLIENFNTKIQSIERVNDELQQSSLELNAMISGLKDDLESKKRLQLTFEESITNCNDQITRLTAQVVETSALLMSSQSTYASQEVSLQQAKSENQELIRTIEQLTLSMTESTDMLSQLRINLSDTRSENSESKVQISQSISFLDSAVFRTKQLLNKVVI